MRKPNVLKTSTTQGEYKKNPSALKAMLMLVLFMLASCCACLVFMSALSAELTHDTNTKAVAFRVVELPFYWTVSIVGGLMFFASWLGDAFHSKS